MKLSDGFDARRLRPKGQSNWRFRFGAAFAALLATCGVLLAMAGAASLLGRPPALGELNASPWARRSSWLSGCSFCTWAYGCGAAAVVARGNHGN